MKRLFTFAFLFFSILTLNAQIVINGYNPQRRHYSGPSNSLSLSYGYNYWKDGGNVPLRGYSTSRAIFHDEFFKLFSIEDHNFAFNINIGYERYLSHRFSLKGTFSTSKLFTGDATRADWDAIDKSRYTQIGVYSSYNLRKNLQKRLQYQWLIGPELIYAKKNVFIYDYIVEESDTPQTYNQSVTVVEGAVVTGLGMSYRLGGKIALYSEIMAGLALPGKGTKATVSTAGLKYTW